MFSVQQLEKIAKTWRQEAEREGDQYYFETEEFRSIADGSKSFVISRKGTGKSAIVMHLKKTARHAVDLSLADLDPAELNRLGPHGSETTKSILYRHTFEYIIYHATVIMMLRNPEVPGAVKQRILSAFPGQAEPELPRNVLRWHELDVNFDVFGVGFGVAGKRAKDAETRSLADKVSMLESFLEKHLQGGPYYVIFDALDENYRAARSQLDPDYAIAITSLFGTVARLRKVFGDKKLFPVITLRDDIFDFLEQADRNKWYQDMVEVTWNEAKIKEMIAHRLAVTAGVEPAPFDELWKTLVGQETATFKGKSWDKYNYIASFTMLRPRDFIAYLTAACAQAAKRAKDKSQTATLSVAVLQNCRDEFSAFFRRELEDELGGQIPKVGALLDALLLGGQNRTVSRKDLAKRYERYIADRHQSGEPPLGLGTAAMLEKLYEFGVIGYQDASRPPKEMFRYSGGQKRLPDNSSLLIHKGLIRARDEDKALFGG